MKNLTKVFFLFSILIFSFSCKTNSSKTAVIEQEGDKNAPEKFDKPYVILISLDGFRWDYVERFQPPNLSKFIKNGVQSESLIPVFPSKTFPNHYSIATGMYPENHGLVNNSFYNPTRNSVYEIRDRSKVEDGTWYGGTPIWVHAANEGYLTASFFFVGSEADIQGVHPTYHYKFDNSIPSKQRVDQAIDWLKMPKEKRPHLITMYFSDMDDIGHRYGPNSDDKLKETLDNLDKHLGNLFEGVAETKLPVNIIIVSDHGMAGVQSENLLYLESIENDSLYRTISTGALVHFYLKNKVDKELVFNDLKSREKNFKIYDPLDSIGMPYFQNNPTHENIGDLIVVPDQPYYFKNARSIGMFKKNRIPEIGHHGFDPKHKEMHGIFYANGSQIKNGLTIPAVENIHVYPLICEILGLEIPEEVDGKLEVLKGILK